MACRYTLPTANLDEVNEEKVIEILQRLHQQGKTIVIATHDQALGDLAQRKIMLRHGRIISGGQGDAFHISAVAR